MDHIMNILIMAHMAENEVYISDSDSDNVPDEVDIGEDAESDCSVYGSTTSNEGDTQDEYEFDDEEYFGPGLAEKCEIDGEHPDASCEQDNVVNDGCLEQQYEIGAPNHLNILQVSSQQSCFSQDKSGDQPCLLEHGIKRSSSDQKFGYAGLKRVRTEECPPDIGAEIIVRTEGTSITCDEPCPGTEITVRIEDNSITSDEPCPSINLLPDDMLLEVFGKLNINTLINIAPVCKRWYELSKHKSLWFHEDVVYDHYHMHQFVRLVRAARFLRTVDVSDMHAAHGESLLTLLNGPETVRRFSCFSVAHPRVIVELLERYRDNLEELNISLSDERLSYGDGGTFKDGVKPRPGYLFKLISEMKSLRVVRFTGMMPSIGHHQGRVNPKWYFGELENPELKLQAIAMKFENPREILLQKFVIPFLKSKIPYLKELRLTSDVWNNKEVQEIVRNCDKLEALVRFPIESLHALENCKQQFFIDFILGSWIDFKKIQNDLLGYKALSHIHEVSLRFCDQLYSLKFEEQSPDIRLETFLPILAGRLHSCKRVHIYRWDAALPFVESVHSTCALAKFLYSLRRTLEEVHISDAFRGGRHFPQLIKTIRESVPHLKSRGIAVNRLGNRGLLFSVKRKHDSIIHNTGPLLLEHGRIEFGSH